MPEPWQLIANTLRVAAGIDIHHPKVQELARRAARDLRLDVRARVPAAIEGADAPWARTLVESLILDEELEVREAACRVTDVWDRKMGIMKDESEVRQIFWSRWEDDSPESRAMCAELLSIRKGTWARVLVRALAQSEHREVREAAQSTLQEWESEGSTLG